MNLLLVHVIINFSYQVMFCLGLKTQALKNYGTVPAQGAARESVIISHEICI